MPPKPDVAQRPAAVFCDHLKKITVVLSEQLKGDRQLLQIKKRLLLALGAVDMSERVLEEGGIYLYGYQKPITTEDEKFFLDQDFKKELSEGVVDEKINAAKLIIAKLKVAWPQFPAATKRVCWVSVQAMLMAYLDHKLETIPAVPPSPVDNGKKSLRTAVK